MALDGAGFQTNREFRPERRGKFRFLTFPFRFVFRLFKRTLAQLVRTLAFHPVSSLLVVVLALAVAFLGYQNVSGGAFHAGPGAADAALTPSPAAEDFIKGQTEFNAALMWSSFSNQFKQQLSTRGTNQQSLQRQLDQRKQAGTKVDQVQYAGGVQTPEGSRVFMYVLTMEAPGSQGVAETHYVLTVDQTDKIVNVE